ncbi:MAG TPA: hypothetical protein VEB66_17935 [Opitutaceae bacterium]|nr:hypothetical protein [Opitutaceae bacterium]
MSRRLTLLVLLAATAAVLGWIGHGLLFTTFMLYDDEGYVLITLRDFGRIGGLYDVIFTQYGPFFYLFYDGLQRALDFAWGSTAGRWITLVNWLGTAGLCALALHRARAPWPLVLFGLVDVFAFLWIMIHEPMHPGGTVTLLVAAAAWLGIEALRSGRLDRFGLVAGLAGAALALTKINVGAFLIFSAAFALALCHRGPHAGPLRVLLFGLGALLPLALMRSLLSAPWVLTFAILSALATGGVLIAARAGLERLPPAGWRPWLGFGAAGLAVTAAVAVLMAARGTSPYALFQGVVVAPLQHPGIYAFAVQWRPGVLAVAGAALGLVALAARRRDDGRWRTAIAWTRIAATLGFQLTLIPSFQTSQAAIALCFGVPLAGLFAFPLERDSDDAGVSARAWLALLLVLQSLHAYPVAGSQLNWGTFLWVPLMLSGFHESVAHLQRNATARRIAWTRGLVGAGAVMLAVGVTGMLGRIARMNQVNGERIGVAGSGEILLPAPIASALRVVTENATAHGSVLLSLPGAYSLNLWSGVPTPTSANVTHWFSLLSPRQQQEMLARLEREPRAVFVVQHNILAALVETGFRPASPVLDYLRAHYRRAFAIEGYSFWVRHDRTIAPLSTGQLLYPPAENQPHRLALTLDRRPGRVARIELWNVAGGQWRVLDLDATRAEVEALPIDLAGAATGPARAAPWPLELDQPLRLTFAFWPIRPLPPPEALEAVLLDASGRRIGAARVLPASALDQAAPVSAAAPPAGD